MCAASVASVPSPIAEPTEAEVRVGRTLRDPWHLDARSDGDPRCGPGRRVVSLRFAACLAMAAMCGCELVVDEGTRVLASADAGGDAASGAGPDARSDVARPPAESGMPDTAATDVGAAQGCSSACLEAATSCQQGCAATEASCLSDCHDPSGPCQDRCTHTATTCNSGCSHQCLSCLEQAACTGSGACSH